MGLSAGAHLGPYRIIRKIGEGGMGEVYEALHAVIERRVAVKVLHPEFVREPEIVERFLNEARVVNRIGHPGLVQVFDYNQHSDGRLYIVMEYLNGGSLAARLKSCGGRLSWAEAVDVHRQIASALSAAHEKGVIHRDLKPDNVMVVATGEPTDGKRVKVLDFGLAKLADRPGTKSDVIMGTPHYMAPEQCRSAKVVTSKSDVYALGVMLFETLAGRLPFPGEGAGELIMMHLFQEPPPLASLVPELPKTLTAFVDSLLTKEPAARPAMSQVMATLASVAEQAAAYTAAGEPRPGPATPQPKPSESVEVAFKPTVAVPAAQTYHLAPPELRRLFEQQLRSDSEFDAFIIDNFPAVKKRFVTGMDRVAKANLLLEMADKTSLAASLRRVFPSAFDRILIVENGEETGRIYPLPCPSHWVIGRGLDADIRMPPDEAHVKVSRRHAILDISTDKIVIRLEGKHPFQVNNETITASRILVGDDRIQIGPTVLRLKTSRIDPDTLVWISTPTDWTDPTPSVEGAATEATREGGLRLFWGLADRVLATGKISEAERMIGPRLTELLTRAVAGEVPTEVVSSDMIARALRLASATKKDAWFGWIFKYAHACKFQIPLPLLEQILAEARDQHPAIGSAVAVYIANIRKEEHASCLAALLEECSPVTKST